MAGETTCGGCGCQMTVTRTPEDSPMCYVCRRPPTAPTAIRHNEGKPESDYIFTYAGGVSAAFDFEHPYRDTLYRMHVLYLEDKYLEEKANLMLASLRKDAVAAGHSIVALIAECNTLGAEEHPPGNYLLGGNWRQYFQSGARHAEKIGQRDPKGYSHTGNFIFNVLMLHHCIVTGIGIDDRIRKP